MAATRGIWSALALSAAALDVAWGSPEVVRVPALLPADDALAVGEPLAEVTMAPELMGVSPTGIDMNPETVERDASVISDTIDSETGRGKGIGVAESTPPLLVPGRVSM